MCDFKYENLEEKYSVPKSHFLGRDALNIEWDSNGKKGWLYRNGDIRAHVVAWESLDYIYEKMTQFPDFRLPTNPKEYADYVKFKFELIAYLYEKRAEKKIIGRPIDVIVLKGTDFGE